MEDNKLNKINKPGFFREFSKRNGLNKSEQREVVLKGVMAVSLSIEEAAASRVPMTPAKQEELRKYAKDVIGYAQSILGHIEKLNVIDDKKVDL